MCCNGGEPHPRGDHHSAGAHTGDVVERFGRPSLAAEDITVDADASGPTAAQLAGTHRLLNEGWLRQHLDGAQTRLISVRVLDTSRSSAPPFAAESSSRTVLCRHWHPWKPDGRTERALVIGLVPARGEQKRHQLVAVNLIRREIVREFEGRAHDSTDECGPPPSGACAATGDSGRVSVRVTQGGNTLWQFEAIRPAASSGTNGSGIELRGVRYRGRQLLYRAHVPILNIEYYNDGTGVGCGPTYRDWQNEETCFQANGSDVIPGYRLCSAPAQTIIESHADTGNFRGVAIYVQGQEVVLVSEMAAGWYRYITAWRLHTDGTIRPRFGFAAANNPCTCRDHHHHVYWRLDFDIRTAGNNVVEEHNSPALFGNANWHTKRYEIRRSRDAARNRHWRVRNLTTGEGYRVVRRPLPAHPRARRPLPGPGPEAIQLELRNAVGTRSVIRQASCRDRRVALASRED